MESCTIGDLKVDEIGRGGRQRRIAVIDVPSRCGGESGQDVVHELQHTDRSPPGVGMPAHIVTILCQCLRQHRSGSLLALHGLISVVVSA